MWLKVSSKISLHGPKETLLIFQAKKLIWRELCLTNSMTSLVFHQKSILKIQPSFYCLVMQCFNAMAQMSTEICIKLFTRISRMKHQYDACSWLIQCFIRLICNSTLHQWRHKLLVPAVTQTLNLISIRVKIVWESHVHQQIFVIFEDFYRQKKRNPAWFR